MYYITTDEHRDTNATYLILFTNNVMGQTPPTLQTFLPVPAPNVSKRKKADIRIEHTKL